MVFLIRNMSYAVVALDADPRVARKAFRLTKQGGDHASYDVHLDEHGPHCECLGFLRWSRPCKHIRTLQDAGMI